MPAKTLSIEVLQSTMDAVALAGGNVTQAASDIGMARASLQARVNMARDRGITASPSAPKVDDPVLLKAEVKRLKALLATAQEKELTHAAVRQSIIDLKLAAEEVTTPRWLKTDSVRKDSAPGVPTIFLSDLHWGEVVDPNQINGVNKFNVEIAHKRLDSLADTADFLLGIVSQDMNYPGIVVILGGDMISGNIHDELAHTNQFNTMPTILDLFGKLCQFIGRMADTYGKVFVPCVTGNHGRDTHKIWSKDRNHTSFDWLLYCFLAKHFEADKRITFLIPDGPDAYFKVYEHRYLLTHGDQFRGGDGVIGALGPIIRGDHRKRSRNGQIDMAYDTMLLGHWHQYMHLTRLIVNGSLKGYDEYAYSNSFPFEAPQQALWLTHPQKGITFRMPVYVDSARAKPKAAWVSVAA